MVMVVVVVVVVCCVYAYAHVCMRVCVPARDWTREAGGDEGYSPSP